MQIRLLGGFGVERDGRPLHATSWRLRKARTLVKLLALTPDQRLHRDVLLDTPCGRTRIPRPPSTTFIRRCTSLVGRLPATGSTPNSWSFATTSWC